MKGTNTHNMELESDASFTCTRCQQNQYRLITLRTSRFFNSFPFWTRLQ
jgi:hypothetical protein